MQESERVAAVLTIRPLPGRQPHTLDHTFVYPKTHPDPPLADFVGLLKSAGGK